MASLQELKENGINLTMSEELELEGKQSEEWYSELRVKGFYRVFDTFYKDEYQCTNFYATGFINSEDGYEWLISESDEYNYESEDDDVIYDAYLVLKGNNKWERKERKMFTGTAEDILELTRKADKKNYKIAERWNVNHC